MTKWYIINVVAGQENKICDDINNIARILPMSIFLKLLGNSKKSFLLTQ